MSENPVIISKINLNLHTKDKRYPSGLVHVPAMRATRVPADVADHPLFADIVDDGTISIVKVRPSKKTSLPLAVNESDVVDASEPKAKAQEIKPLSDDDDQSDSKELPDLQDEDEDEDEDENKK